MKHIQKSIHQSENGMYIIDSWFLGNCTFVESYSFQTPKFKDWTLEELNALLKAYDFNNVKINPNNIIFYLGEQRIDLN